MPLQLDVIYKDIQVTGALVSVNLPTIGVGRTTMSFGAWFKATPTSELFDAQVFESAPYDITGPDPFTQAYTYLKTLPEFAEAVYV